MDVGLADGALRVRAPKGILTAVQRECLIEHHAEIISLLDEPANDREALADDLRAIFDERAAIAEFDGGLDHEAAERLARQEVTSGPAGDDVTAWRPWMRSRLPVWRERGLSAREAARLVWSKLKARGTCGTIRRPIPTAAPDAANGCSMVRACGCSTAP